MATFLKTPDDVDPVEEWVVGSLAPFGQVIGYARNTNGNGIEVYSCHYESANRASYRGRSSFINVGPGGVFYGFKYQCVEFARRWLVEAMNVTFESIDMAYEGFDLTSFKQLPGMNDIPIECIVNGSTEVVKRPQYGNVIIWNEGGYFRSTGHIGIITEATDTYVLIAEQNYNDLYWPQGQSYSRELPVRIGDDGSYFIIDSTLPEYPNCGRTSVRGWIRVILPENHIMPAPSSITSSITSSSSLSSSSSSSSSSTTAAGVSSST